MESGTMAQPEPVPQSDPDSGSAARDANPQPVAFVAGATGYTGAAVVAELCRRGIRTTAHVRPDSPKLLLWQDRFTGLGAQVSTAAWELEALRAEILAVSPTLVFSLLGTTKKRARSSPESTYDAVDYGLTLLLAQACTHLPTAPRVLYLSSLGSGPKATGAYLRCRWRTEEMLRETGLPLCIARPSFITGPDRRERRLGEAVGAGLIDGALGALRLVGAVRTADRLGSITATELAAGLVSTAIEATAAEVVLGSDQLRNRCRR